MSASLSTGKSAPGKHFQALKMEWLLAVASDPRKTLAAMVAATAFANRANTRTYVVNARQSVLAADVHSSQSVISRGAGQLVAMQFLAIKMVGKKATYTLNLGNSPSAQTAEKKLRGNAAKLAKRQEDDAPGRIMSNAPGRIIKRDDLGGERPAGTLGHMRPDASLICAPTHGDCIPEQIPEEGKGAPAPFSLPSVSGESLRDEAPDPTSGADAEDRAPAGAVLHQRLQELLEQKFDGVDAEDRSRIELLVDHIGEVATIERLSSETRPLRKVARWVSAQPELTVPDDLDFDEEEDEHAA